MRKLLSGAVLALIFLVPPGCGNEAAPDEAEAADPPSPARAEAIAYFKKTCVLCHGEKGHGDGPGAANLNPKPRSYNDPKWLAQAKIEKIMKVILEGGASIGKSPLMPPNPVLKDKPEVLRALAEYVLELGHAKD